MMTHSTQCLATLKKDGIHSTPKVKHTSHGFRPESTEKSRKKQSQRDANDGLSSRERQEKLAARTKPFPK